MNHGPTWDPCTVHDGSTWDPYTVQVRPTWDSRTVQVGPHGTCILFMWDPHTIQFGPAHKIYLIIFLYINNNTTLYTTFTCGSPTIF